MFDKYFLVFIGVDLCMQSDMKGEEMVFECLFPLEICIWSFTINFLFHSGYLECDISNGMITEDSWFWNSNLSVEMDTPLSEYCQHFELMYWFLPTIMRTYLVLIILKTFPLLNSICSVLIWISQLVYFVRSVAARDSSTHNTNALNTGFLLCLHSQGRKYFNLLLTFVTSFSVSDHIIFIARCLYIFFG